MHGRVLRNESSEDFVHFLESLRSKRLMVRPAVPTELLRKQNFSLDISEFRRSYVFENYQFLLYRVYVVNM